MCSCDYIARNTTQQLQSETNKQTYFIQLICNCTGVTKLQEMLPSQIEKILCEELSLENNESLFLKKDKQRISLYYLNDTEEQGESLIIKALENEQKINGFKNPRGITIAENVDFFGEWNDELVLTVNDPQHELGHLNHLIKDLAYSVDSMYRDTYKLPLFDKAKSEHFPFVPHIGLGRLRSNSIKQRVQDPTQAEKILERIKKRVKDVTLKLISETITSVDDKRITCDTLVLFSLTKRVSIQEFSF